MRFQTNTIYGFETLTSLTDAKNRSISDQIFCYDDSGKCQKHAWCKQPQHADNTKKNDWLLIELNPTQTQNRIGPQRHAA